MNVLQLPLRFFPESLGGVEVYVAALARQLQERGIGTTIAAPADTHAEYDHDGVRVVRFATGEFERVLDRAAPDLVHIHAMIPEIFPPLVRQISKRRIPIVLTCHLAGVVCPRGTLMQNGAEVCDGVWGLKKCTTCILQQKGLPVAFAAIVSALPMGAGERLAGWSLSRRARTVLRMQTLQAARHGVLNEFLGSMDRVVAVSEWMREMLIANGADPARVLLCRHGATQDTPSPHAARATNGVLKVAFLGRLHWTKGPHMLIEALRRRPGLAVQLDIFGIIQEESPYIAELKAAIDRDARIRLLEPIKNAEVVERLRSYDVVAVPSQLMETGPLVVYDAFLAGIPVIGSRRGGLIELVTDNQDGLLIEPADAESWARALEALAGDRARLARLRAAVRTPRSMHDVTREMMALYSTLS